ncbi:MAG TPA: SusC/RagA family TonB-linked outer membrane protein, partial [Odoribacter splanchnicus]|nr:SusC/RagA family TonB-linked outer membrane protein [Odoribacter splanchnicus]
MQKNACSVSLSLRKRRLTAIIFCLLSAFSLPIPLQAGVPQQQSTYPVNGLVTDAKGVPLPGVTVRYGITGGVTDNGGRFSLRLPEERGRLTFSCVGYKTVTVGYRAGETLRVRLEESRESLEEVTVVAYGEQRRGQVSGSVATVDAARLQNKPASNVLTLAKGQMAGVYIASQSGDPGGNDVSIIVRGANDLAIAGNRNPLFVIDGVIASDDASLKVGGNPLTSLNPDDIETFTVLKDAAAAAIYGSRAANGVVIITTKKGRYNQHPMLSANVSHTFILQPLLPERIGG